MSENVPDVLSSQAVGNNNSAKSSSQETEIQMQRKSEGIVNTPSNHPGETVICNQFLCLSLAVTKPSSPLRLYHVGDSLAQVWQAGLPLVTALLGPNHYDCSSPRESTKLSLGTWITHRVTEQFCVSVVLEKLYLVILGVLLELTSLP